jgi:hypothetical protein
MVPTSTPNIYKVFNNLQVVDNLHMLWMGIWIHHHSATTKSGWYRKE